MFGGSNPVSTPPSEDTRNRLLATGGGGCACSVPGARGSSLPPSAAFALLGLLGVVLRLRRRSVRLRRGSLIALAALALIAVSSMGCRVQPFCVDCSKAAPAPKPVDGGIQLADGRVIPNEDGGHSDVDATTPGTDGSMPGEPDGSTMTPQCQKTGPEKCNGKDDDCDFKVDEDYMPTTADIDNCLHAGVCAAGKPVCAGGKSVCRYPTTYEADETTCDLKDNDCDGKVDETFPKAGDACQVGVGECRVSGKYECNGAGTDVTCVAGKPKQPSNEICDGKDNDCDGLVDEPSTKKGSNPSYVDQAMVTSVELCDGQDNDCDGKIDEPKGDPGINPSYVHDDVVEVSSNLFVYKYEASRIDATATDSGQGMGRACSRPNVMPWVNVTYGEAKAACTAAGMSVCAVADWVTACTVGSCGWAYTPATGTCNDGDGQDDTGDYVKDGATGCNGHDITKQPGDADTDKLLATGSKAMCYANQPMGHIFDLSGNAKEWTTGSGSPTQNPLRGGSYNNAPDGLRCDFDFAVGSDKLRLPNVGFRCCSATAPN
jgi:MYXO-CTERM domain-containing protein